MNLTMEPVAGTYRMKRTKGGVWTPVLIYRLCCCTIGGDVDHMWSERCDRFPPLQAVIDGIEDADPLQIWTWLHPIAQAEYDLLMSSHAWARENAPELPEANTRKAVDLNALKPLF